VICTLDATARLAHCAHLLASELAADARNARWLLAVSATGRGLPVAAAAQLVELVPSADRLVFVAAVAVPGAERGARELAAQDLLSALS
jgi:hypothetical protein